MAEAPLPYSEVLKSFAQAKAKYPDRFGSMHIADFSRWMNQSLGTDRYRVGESAKGVTGAALQFSEGLTDILRPVSQKTKEVGGDILGIFGPTGREIGESVGEHTPRAVADLGLTLGGLALGPPGLPLTALGLGSTGANTFSQTGSYPAAAVSAGTNLLLPGAAKFGENVAARTVTPAIEKFIGSKLPFLSQRLPAFAGEQAGLFGLTEGSRQAQSVVSGQGLAPITPRTVGENLASNIPFLPFDVPKLARGYKVDYTGATPQPRPASFRDIVQPGEQQFFGNRLLAQRQADTPTLPDVQEPVATLAEVAERRAERKTVPLDDPDALESVLDEISPQLALPFKVGDKPASKSHVSFADRAFAEEFAAKKGLKPTFNKALKQWEVDWEPEFKPKAAFSPEQLGGGFGLIAAEQLNNPKPYGIARLPGDKLPGNSLVQRLPKVLPKEEWELLKLAGFEDFVKGRPVGIGELQQWMNENGPRVEVNSKNLRPESRGIGAQDQLEHNLETAFGARSYPLFNDNGELTGVFSERHNSFFPHVGVVDENMTSVMQTLRERGVQFPTVIPEDVQTMLRTYDMRSQAERGMNPQGWDEVGGGANWSGVAPKPESAMPGYVEFAVTIPYKDSDKIDYSRSARDRGVLFPSSHNFPPNTLGFGRGYVETLPNGEKVFHVIEVQSDWGQDVRNFSNQYSDAKVLENPDGGWSIYSRDVPMDQRNDANEMQGPFNTKEEAQRSLDREFNKTHKNHPLLNDYNRLVLKAAIDEARKAGATKIAISDAETAMMTEGHDLHAEPTPEQVEQLNAQFREPNRLGTPEHRIATRELYASARPSQEPGMRLNYDQILPGILKELTGSEGVKNSFGDHKNALAEQFGPGPRFQPRQNLIFKNPDGSPKTDVSAHVYSLDKVTKELMRRGGWTLFGRDKLAAEAQKLEAEGATTEAIARSMVALAETPRKPGESLADVAAREVGLPDVINADVPPEQFLSTVHSFFDRYFTLKGEAGPRKDFLIRNALLLASKFEGIAGRTRLAEVLSGPSFHAPAREGKFNSLIGLRTSKSLSKRELENLRILWDFGHEMTHELESQILANPKLIEDSPLHAAYGKVMASSKTLDAVEKDAIMKSLVRHGMPDANGEYDYKGQLYKQFSREDVEAENSEFVADFLSILGLSSSNSKAQTGEYLQFANKETQDLGGLFMKDLTQSLSAVKDLTSQFLKATLPKVKSVAFRSPDTGEIYPGRGQLHAVAMEDFPNLPERVERGFLNDRGSFMTILDANKLAERKAELEARLPEVLSALEEMYGNATKILEGVQRGEDANAAFRALMDRTMTTAYDRPPVVSYKQMRQMYDRLGAPKNQIKEADIPSDLLDEVEENVVPVAGGKRLKMYEKLYPATQLAQSYPEVKPLVDMVRDVRARVSRSTEEMWKHFHDSTGKVDQERMKELGQMGPVGKAFSDVALLQQMEERSIRGEELKSYLRQKHPKLTEEQVARVDKSLQQMEGVSQEAFHLLVRGHLDTTTSKVTLALQSHNRNLTPNQAEQLAQKIVNLVTSPPQNALPEQMLMIEQTLKTEAGGENAYAVAKDVANGGLQGLNILKEKLGNRPWFFSEVRPHAWMVYHRNAQGEKVLESFKTQKEAQKRLEGLTKAEARGEVSGVKSFNKNDTNERWRGLQRDAIEAYREADQRLFEATLRGLEGHADQATLDAVREEFKPGDGAYRIVSPPYMQERALTGGREDLNMMEQMLNYVNAVAYGTTKRWAKQKEQVLLNSPRLRENPALQNVMREYVSNFLDPQGAEFTKLKNFIFMNFMGFNLSTNLVELTQNFMTTAPALIRKGATVGQSYRALTKAMGEVGAAYLKGKSFKRPEYSDPEIANLIDRLEHERIVDKGVLEELYSLEDALTVSRRNILSGNGKPSTAKEVAANAVYHVSRLARDLYGVSTQFNSRVAGVAAYRIARAKGLDHEAAYEFTKDIISVGLFGGGRANRPTVLSGLGKAQGVGGLMYSLSGYTFNLLAMYARFAKEAVGGDAQARKALGTMLAAQTLVGGVLGLPAVGGVIAVLEQMFPDLELKKNLRQAFTSFAGDDEKLGHIFGDVGMSGMFNSGITPADVGSRYQLGTLLGVDPYHGFQWGNLLGPVTGMLENIVKGTQKAASGDYWNAAEKVAPAGLRGLVRMLGEDGGFRDEKGKLIIDPTPAEQLVTALGFRPKRLNQYYEQQSVTKRSEEIEARRKDGLYRELAGKFISGDVSAVRARLLEESREARSAGEVFDPRVALARIVEIVQERLVPVDPTRSGARGNVQERSEIARMFPRPVRPSEVQLYLKRKQLERQVGIPGAGRMDARSLSKAQMIDRLMGMNPRLTYSEAKAQVERVLSPRL